MKKIINSNFMDYRLGDALKAPYLGKNNPKRNKPMYQYTIEKWPRSIVAQYYAKYPPVSYSKRKTHTVNYEYLKDICKQYKLPRGVHRPYTAVHLRIGDILRNYNPNKEILIKDSPLQHKIRFIPPKYYLNIVKKIKRKGIDKVYLVYGFHLNLSKETIDKNKKYIENVKKIFEDQSIKPITISQEPDEDFAFLSTADLLIPSKGGFANMVKRTNKEYLKDRTIKESYKHKKKNYSRTNDICYIVLLVLSVFTAILILCILTNTSRA